MKGADQLSFLSAGRYWLRRVWQAPHKRLPTLEIREGAEVFAQVRHQARASVDYYVQIFLASTIAVLGLRLDSGAVIIGAMLVASALLLFLTNLAGISSPRCTARRRSHGGHRQAHCLTVSSRVRRLGRPHPPTGSVDLLSAWRR